MIEPTANNIETNSNPNDAALIKRAQNGDMKAFDELVVIYRGKIYAMIYHMINNEADAWDLAQETFIKAWKALPRFEERSGFFTWLYRIAHNVTYDSLRKRKIKKESEFDDSMAQQIDPRSQTTPDGGLRPDHGISSRELGAKIHSALEKLSEEHREVIVLKEIQGMKYHEIAEVMSCTEGTVMSRLFYARKKLQELLKDEYYEYCR